MKKMTLKILLTSAILLTSVLFARIGFSYDKMLKKPPEKICGLCHADKEKSSDTSGHGKLDVTCQMCHNPHGDGNGKMLKKPAEEFCFLCHSDKKQHYMGSGHGKVKVSCQMCHDPHGTPNEEKAPPAAPKPK